MIVFDIIITTSKKHKAHWCGKTFSLETYLCQIDSLECNGLQKQYVDFGMLYIMEDWSV